MPRAKHAMLCHAVPTDGRTSCARRHTPMKVEERHSADARLQRDQRANYEKSSCAHAVAYSSNERLHGERTTCARRPTAPKRAAFSPPLPLLSSYPSATTSHLSPLSISSPHSDPLQHPRPAAYLNMPAAAVAARTRRRRPEGTQTPTGQARPPPPTSAPSPSSRPCSLRLPSSSSSSCTAMHAARN